MTLKYINYVPKTNSGPKADIQDGRQDGSRNKMHEMHESGI